MLIMKRVAACMLTALLLLSAVPVSTMASEGTTDVGIAEAGYHDILLETAPIFGTVAENAREPASDADAGATIGATNEYFSGAGRGTGVLFSWEEEADEPSSAAAGQTAGESFDENLSSGETASGEAAYADPAADEPSADQASDSSKDQIDEPSADQIEETYSGRTEEIFADQADGEETSLNQLPVGDMTGGAAYEDPAGDEILTEEETGQAAYEDPAADEILTGEETGPAAYEDPAAEETLTEEETGPADYEDPAAEEILTGEETGPAAYEDPAAEETLTGEETGPADYEDPAAEETLTGEETGQTVYEDPAVEQVPFDMAAEEKQPAEVPADPAGGVYNNAADVPTGGEIDDFAIDGFAIDDFAVTEEESASPALGASEALPADAAEGSSVQAQTDPDAQKTGEEETDENGEKTEDTENSVPASVDDRAALMGMSLSLTDQIVMNIYVRTDSSVEGDDYIEFECAGNTVRQMVRDAGASQMTMADGETIDVLIFEMPLRLRQMTDDVTFHMVVDDEAGRSLTRTVRTYADQILGGFFPEEQKNITRAMLNCGAYVQDYFGYNTDRPANAGIFAAGTNPVSDWEDPDMSSFGYSLHQADSSQAFRFIETTLELKEDISLICYYTMEYDWGDLFSDYSFTLKNSDKELEMGYDRDKGMYYVKVSHIMPYELDQVFELEVEKGLLWFNPQSVATLKYSPLSYCREMLQSPDSSDSIRNLCKSLYYYWQAASTVR